MTDLTKSNAAAIGQKGAPDGGLGGEQGGAYGGGDGEIGAEAARALAIGVRRLLNSASNRLDADNARSPLAARLTDHIGVPFTELVAVTQEYRSWEHAGLQRGIDAYLDARSPGAEWFGIAGAERHYDGMSAMLTAALRHGTYELGRPTFVTAATGPDTTMEVVELGLVATLAPDGAPVVVGVMTRETFETLTVLTVFARDRTTAASARDEIHRLREAHDVLRGQVLKFGASEHHGNELVTFLPRPELTAADVVLPGGRLDAIEAHVVGIAEHAERLLAAGQHLKRGLLLYGPPGTGKTHTVRYLMSRLDGYTVIQLTGPAMRFLDMAVALARRLSPSAVIIEDVDLVAEDREMADDSHPLLFSLLDAMDGVGGDANVVFMLTTNRVRALERALTERPGRIDLAVEIPRPDSDGRLRLLRLYGRALRLAADLDAVAARTEGVTASFIKELVRRAVLVALRDGTSSVEALTDAHFGAALDEMFDAASSLTRGLLGAASDASDPDARPDEDAADFDDFEEDVIGG